MLRLKRNGTKVTQDRLNSSLIGDLVIYSTCALTGLVISFIAAHLFLHFYDKRLQLIGDCTQERVKRSGFLR